MKSEKEELKEGINRNCMRIIAMLNKQDFRQKKLVKTVLKKKGTSMKQ